MTGSMSIQPETDGSLDVHIDRDESSQKMRQDLRTQRPQVRVSGAGILYDTCYIKHIREQLFTEIWTTPRAQPEGDVSVKDRRRRKIRSALSNYLDCCLSRSVVGPPNSGFVLKSPHHVHFPSTPHFLVVPAYLKRFSIKLEKARNPEPSILLSVGTC